MDEIEANSLVGELIEEEDIASLDVLFTLAFGDYHAVEKNLSLIKISVGKIAEHNLEVKYGGDVEWRKSKLAVARRLEEECNFYPDSQNIFILRSMLIREAEDCYRVDTAALYQEAIKKRLERLASIEINALAFIHAFSLYSLNIKEEEDRSGIVTGKGFSTCPDFFCRSRNKHFALEFETLIFNCLFDKKLRRSKEICIPKEDELFCRKIQEKLYPYELGDIAVKSGMAFWCPWVTNYSNVHLNFTIPDFLYNILKQNRYRIVKQNRKIIEGFEHFKIEVERISKELEGANIQREYPSLRQQRRNYYTGGEIEDWNTSVPQK